MIALAVLGSVCEDLLTTSQCYCPDCPNKRTDPRASQTHHSGEAKAPQLAPGLPSSSCHGASSLRSTYILERAETAHEGAQREGKGQVSRP